jgi:hypothetical protein
MTNFSHKRLDTLLVAVHNAQPPTDADWKGYMDLCVDLERDLDGHLERARALIFTDGGVPTGTQRNQITKLLRGRSAASAVVTDNLMVRAALGLLSVINPGVKVFSTRDWKKAAEFANVAPERHLEILKVAVALGREVGDCKALRTIGL